LRGIRIIPKVWVFGLGVQLGKTAGSGIDVKDASLAIPRIARSTGQEFRLRRAFGDRLAGWEKQIS
jgi:hypothetical protein